MVLLSFVSEIQVLSIKLKRITFVLYVKESYFYHLFFILLLLSKSLSLLTVNIFLYREISDLG